METRACVNWRPKWRYKQKSKGEKVVENYIFIDGKKTVLTDSQVEKLKESFYIPDTKLGDVKIGDVAKLAGRKFIVLEQNGEETALILADTVKDDVVFGKTDNNYNGSNVEKICNKFAEELAKEIGEENILLHDVDLTSDDGLKDYGTIKRRASLLTADMYRKFVEILDNYKLNKYWWLATPHSTKRHENDQWMLCVSPAGYISFVHYSSSIGFRPFCILKSNIFVSK